MYVGGQRVIGLDISFNCLKIAKSSMKKHTFVNANATQISFKDRTFDCVVCSGFYIIMTIHYFY